MDSSAVKPEPADLQDGWVPLENFDPKQFPARARLSGQSIVVFNTKAGLRGTSRACPHMQATMMMAELAGNETMVRCPLHVFTFRLSDGKGVNCPGYGIEVFEIRERDGLYEGRHDPRSSVQK